MNGFMVLPALLQLAVLKWIPESPRWLAQKQRHAAVCLVEIDDILIGLDFRYLGH